MIEGALIAGILMFIGSKLAPVPRLLLKTLFFMLILLPLCIILWQIGAFQMLGNMIYMIIKSIFEVIWIFAVGAYSSLLN